MLLAPNAAGQNALTPSGRVELPKVQGRIDHMAADEAGTHLFVAALGNDTVEVLDVAGNRHEKSVAGFGEPQGLVHLPQSGRLIVANGSANRVDILDAGSSLSIVKRIEQLDDADNLRYDAAAGKVVVGYGKGALRFMDADSGASAGEIRLAGHPESFQLETTGSRIFVNLPKSQKIAVIDRSTRAILATWTTGGPQSNYPMALDEAEHRILIGTRKPGRLVVLDMATGKIVANVPCAGDMDDLYFDTGRKRIYVPGGEGFISVFEQKDPNHYVEIARIPSSIGARTGYWYEKRDRLYLAVPGRSGQAAEIWVFEAQDE